MGRTLLTWLFLLLVFAGTGAAGYAAAAKGPAQDQTLTIPGWCCLSAGEDCQESVNLATCEGNSGLLFDTSRRVCNSVCQTVFSAD